MARQTSSGTGGAVVAVVIFVFTTVVFGVTTILFYSQVEDAEKAAAAAEKELAQYADAKQLTDPALSSLTVEDGNTIVGQLLHNLTQVKTLATGEPKLTYKEMLGKNDEIKQQLAAAELGSLTPDGGYVPLILTLIDNYNTTNQALQTAEAELQARTDELQAVSTAKEEFTTSVQEGAAESDTRFNDLKDDIGGQSARLDDLESEFTEQNQGVRDQMSALIQATQDELEKREEVIREQADTINKLKGSEGTNSPEEWRNPDGKIVGILQGGDFVTVDLGYNDKVFAGMSFEVFDPEAGVVVDQDGALRGHASVLLTKVEADTSVARIVRLERNAIIRPGDIIANVVYHPKKTYKFHVFGDFDIKNNGNPTLADRRRIEGMVSRWGGKLTDDMSFDVDFLVLGIEPQPPAPLDDSIIDPLKIQEHRELTELYNRYQELAGRALELQIPVLNQNRFLALVGYYER